MEMLLRRRESGATRDRGIHRPTFLGVGSRDRQRQLLLQSLECELQAQAPLLMSSGGTLKVPCQRSGDWESVSGGCGAADRARGGCFRRRREVLVPFLSVHTRGA